MCACVSASPVAGTISKCIDIIFPNFAKQEFSMASLANNLDHS